MATNVTEKDKTLNEIIDMCVEKRIHYHQFLNDFMLTHSEDWHDSADVTYGERIMFLRGKIQAFDECAACCESMLGYSGSMPSCLNYEDIDDSSPDLQPQVGDYGVAVLENAHGQEEIPFHVEREEHTGLPVALLNTRLYAKPEDDIDDGQYVSLFQLYLDGFMLSRTGRKRNKDAEA